MHLTYPLALTDKHILKVLDCLEKSRQITRTISIKRTTKLAEGKRYFNSYKKYTLLLFNKVKQRIEVRVYKANDAANILYNERRNSRSRFNLFDIFLFFCNIQEALLSAKEEMQNLTIREMELTNEVMFSIAAVL